MKNRTNLLLLSLLFHLLLFFALEQLWPKIYSPTQLDDKSFQITYKRLPPNKIEEKEKDPSGQIVDVSPTNKKEPVKSNKVAEENSTVEKETQTKEKAVAPEIIAPTFSEEKELQIEEAEDINMTEPSSGATAGVRKPKPKSDGPLMSIPSQFRYTNKKGTQRPTVASSTQAQLAGAPSSDLLDVEYGDRLELNTKAYRFASYMNQIKRLVSYYWNQNLKNLDDPLSLNKYTTELRVIINDDGTLSDIKIVQSSGHTGVDTSIVQAFYLAAPFPEPPELLVENNKVLLPHFVYELNVQRGAPSYQGIDPRANVRFPGMLKNGQ